ncbi:MAG TPA: hypothetical protein DCO77_04025 [Nitrospiraceae bacterium]|nr:hypothetical protein [Nitrospiraceae bacterium]
MILKRMQEAASRYPDTTALQFKAGEAYQKYTYRELVTNIASVSSSFSQQGVRQGDRVAILSENRPEWFFAYLATVALGAVVVPLDAQLTDKEVALLLESSEAKTVCVSGQTRHLLPPGGSFKVIAFDGGVGISFSDMLLARRDATLPPAPSADDLAAILYTSGTTGDPKGVMLTHGNVASNCDSLIRLNLVFQTDTILCILPLHHTYPAMVCMILPLSLGATVTMLNSLKGPDILAAMQETGVTIMVGVPLLFAALRRAIFDEIRKKPALVRLLVKLFLGLNRLLRKTVGVNVGKALFGQVHAKFGPKFRFFASGGARLDPDVHRGMSSLGFTVIEGYGLTETSPVSAFNPLTKQKAGSIGIQVPGVEVKIVDPDDKGMGEIAIRGPNVMAGYYRKPAETAEVLRNGWFFTGDLGYRDGQGYFFITGRSKEVIVLATGKNIFPEELEKIYKQLPAVKEICLVMGERGLEAAVVPDFEYLRKMNISHSRDTIETQIADLTKDLSPYKRIMGFKVFKDSLPATRLGKLKRSKVRALYLAEEEQQTGAVTEEDQALLTEPVGKRVLLCLEPFSAKKPILPDDNLELDLGLDSLARVELVVNIEKSLGVKLPESFGSEVFTVKDAVLKLQELLARGTIAEGEQVSLSWAEILEKEPSEEALRSLKLEAGVFLNAVKYIIRTFFFKAFLMLFGRMSVRGRENLPEKRPVSHYAEPPEYRRSCARHVCDAVAHRRENVFPRDHEIFRQPDYLPDCQTGTGDPRGYGDETVQCAAALCPCTSPGQDTLCVSRRGPGA